MHNLLVDGAVPLSRFPQTNVGLAIGMNAGRFRIWLGSTSRAPVCWGVGCVWRGDCGEYPGVNGGWVEWLGEETVGPFLASGRWGVETLPLEHWPRRPGRQLKGIDCLFLHTSSSYIALFCCIYSRSSLSNWYTPGIQKIAVSLVDGAGLHSFEWPRKEKNNNWKNK